MITIKRNELLERMIRNGYTGAGLARATKISKSYVCQMLSGKRSIMPPTAKKIVDVLDCEFDDIFVVDVEAGR